VVEYDDEGQMSDVIRGKGQGSVFLFYGPPGVGKTLTAEAVAEMLHRPLYQVSMGELGTTPDTLESGLKAILDGCSRWKALVLLDEADIFLERRSSSGDLLRNAMVSVVLRMVEYFAGVLFLTTNRVASFDPAFQTRITVALRVG
jgi:SpoVK/Ycf46/Vps4 family AAA+-type ATPase